MRLVLAGAAAIAAMSSAWAAQTPERPAPASRLGTGYLETAAPADSLILSPPPPAPGSAAAARDVEASKAALALKGSARWTLAAADADLFGPRATGTFSCAAGVEIGPRSTPAVDRLLRRTLADLGLSTSLIKRKYQRPRPFMVNGQPICTPDMEPILRRDGSYPSGHSAIGYGWALILAELLPERADRLVARGRDFGDSRRLCNVHWLSDVEEGRVAAAAVVARLHADRGFRQDLETARAELAKPGATPPARDCAAEAATLELGR